MDGKNAVRPGRLLIHSCLSSCPVLKSNIHKMLHLHSSLNNIHG